MDDGGIRGCFLGGCEGAQLGPNPGASWTSRDPGLERGAEPTAAAVCSPVWRGGGGGQSPRTGQRGGGRGLAPPLGVGGAGSGEGAGAVRLRTSLAPPPTRRPDPQTRSRVLPRR